MGYDRQKYWELLLEAFEPLEHFVLRAGGERQRSTTVIAVQQPTAKSVSIPAASCSLSGPATRRQAGRL